MNPIMIPFAYNLPFPSEILSNKKDIIDKLTSVGKEKSDFEKSIYNLSIIKSAVEILRQEIPYGKREYNCIYNALRIYLLIKYGFNNAKIYKDGWLTLINQLKNPFNVFKSLKLSEKDKIQGRLLNEDPNFVLAIREIGRDHKITSTEMKFIQSKAKEYGVPEERLTLYLKNHSILDTAFNLLLDEICSDGRVTTAEKKFIIEKAKEYNLSIKDAEKMLKASYLQAVNDMFLKRNKIFYHYLIQYFFVKFFLKRSEVTQKFYRFLLSAKKEGKDLVFDNDYRIQDLNQIIAKAINEKIPYDSYTLSANFIEFNEMLIQDLSLEYFDLPIMNSENSLYENDNKLQEDERTEIRKIKAKTALDEVNINGFTYSFDQVNLGVGRILYEHTIQGTNVLIKINIGHSIFKYNNDPCSHAIKKIILALVISKMDHDDYIIDRFFDKFPYYQSEVHYSLRGAVS